MHDYCKKKLNSSKCTTLTNSRTKASTIKRWYYFCSTLP